MNGQQWRGHPFGTSLRLALIGTGSALAGLGVAAIFLAESEAGAAALITAGVAVGVLGTIGPYVEAFKLGGLEANFRKQAAADAMQDAIEAAAESAGVRVTTGDKSGALRRAEAHLAMLRRASILWVDDDPGRNDAERRMFTALGVGVDIALDNAEARDKTNRRPYDCIVSDIARPEGEPSGLALAESVNRWLIYYVSHLEDKGTPPGALGITNRPDHLLHYVLDAVEREKFEDMGSR